MSKDTFIQDFWNLFGGRRDVYARAFPHRNPDKRALGKLEYAPAQDEQKNYLPFTDTVLASHLRGDQLIGMYPIVDGKVNFAVIDFDAPKGFEGDDPFPVSWNEAEEHAARLEAEGLNVHLERSRSGKGTHLWMFFDGWVEGHLVRQAIKPLLVKAETLDRLYPVQGDTRNLGKKLGNLIALPFNGKTAKDGFSSFLNRDTMEPIAPREFLASVTKNFPAVIERLAAKAPRDLQAERQAERDRLKALRDSDPNYVAPATDDIVFEAGDGRPDKPLRGWCKAQSEYGCGFLNHCWVNRATLAEPEWYAAIQQATAFEHGREIAHAISRDYKGYNAAEVDRKFDNALKNPPMGCAKIRDAFPHLACKGCLNTAPYHMAKKSILDLALEAEDGTETGGFTEFLDECFLYDEGKKTPGIQIGIEGLDSLLTLRRKEYLIFAARPSMGKTALIVDMANLIASPLVDQHGEEKRGPHPVIVFSGETGREGLKTRFLANEGDVDSRALRGERRAGDTILRLTEEERARLIAAAEALNEKPIHVNYTALDPDRMIEIVEDTMLTHGIPLDEHVVVMFDYVQFGVQAPGESMRERVARISAQLKYMAKILNCTVIAMAQIGREAERKNKDGEVKGGDLTDLKESGSLEQDADGVGILEGERTPGNKSPREINLLKQREGPIGKTHYILDKSTCRFRPLYPSNPTAAGDLLADSVPPAFELTAEDDE